MTTKANKTNFWSGTIKKYYLIDDFSIVGSCSSHVYYYEQGNMQLKTSYNESGQVSTIELKNNFIYADSSCLNVYFESIISF